MYSLELNLLWETVFFPSFIKDHKLGISLGLFLNILSFDINGLGRKQGQPL